MFTTRNDDDAIDLLLFHWLSQRRPGQVVASCCAKFRTCSELRSVANWRETARNGAQLSRKSMHIEEMACARNETKRNELQRNELSLFRFVSVRCSSFRFVSFRRSALTCARTELQRTATNRFWTVLGRRDPVLSTNQSRAECRFAENSRRIIQFRRILETAMCRLPYLTHSRDYNYRRKCFIETQI